MALLGERSSRAWRLRNRRGAALLTMWLGVLIAVLSALSVAVQWLAPIQLFGVLVLAGVVLIGSYSWWRNAIAGVVLAMEGKLSVGDIVVVGGVEGTIEGFGLRSIDLRTFDGARVEVPNQRCFSVETRVLRRNGRSLRLDADVSITISLGDRATPERIRRQAVWLVLSSPFAAARHEPEVSIVPVSGQPGAFQIHVRAMPVQPGLTERLSEDLRLRFGTRLASQIQTQPGSSAMPPTSPS